MSRAASNTRGEVRIKAAATPKSSFVDTKGKEVKINTASKEVNTIRTKVTEEKYVNRNTRVQNFYGPVYQQPIPAGYSVFQSNSTFNIWFWMWLMDRADANERTQWCYNNRSQISDDEWKELVKKDADLEARVKQLEAEKKGERDAGYVPSQFAEDPDLMYTTEYVNAVYNPEEVVEEVAVEAEESESDLVTWVVLLVIGVIVLGGGYLVFVKDWS